MWTTSVRPNFHRDQSVGGPASNYRSLLATYIAKSVICVHSQPLIPKATRGVDGQPSGRSSLPPSATATAVGWRKAHPISAKRVQGHFCRPQLPMTPSTAEPVRGARDQSGSETMFLHHEHRHRRHLHRQMILVARGHVTTVPHKSTLTCSFNSFSLHPATPFRACHLVLACVTLGHEYLPSSLRYSYGSAGERR